MVKNNYISGLASEFIEGSEAVKQYKQVTMEFCVKETIDQYQAEQSLLAAISILFYKFSCSHTISFPYQKKNDLHIYRVSIQGKDTIKETERNQEIISLSYDEETFEGQYEKKIFVLNFGSGQDSEANFKSQGYNHILKAMLQNEKLLLESQYLSNQYSEEYIVYFMKKLVWLTELCLFDKESTVGSIILENHHFSRKAETKLSCSSITALIQRSCVENGSRIAIEEGNKKISYNELMVISDTVARNVINCIHRGKNVLAIIGEGCSEYILSVVGLLKVGITFIPISNEIPTESIKEMLKTAHCQDIILLDEDKLEEWKDYNVIRKSDLFLYSIGDVFELKQNKNALAYIIFTSGSTGAKKGVKCSVDSLCNYILWAQKMYCSEEKPIMPFFTSIGVDLTITSTFLPLIAGGKLIVYSDKNKVKNLSNIVKENAVNLIKLTPSHLKIMLTMHHIDTQLKKMILGGEGLKKSIVDSAYHIISKNVEIYNEYGPTEATVGCMCYKCDPDKDLKMNIQLGESINNCNIYILDEDKKPSLKYAFGELYIGGLVLSDGYVGDEKETRKVFLENIVEEEKKLYKTGDIVRINGDDSIEYCGRTDELVKIGGRRCSLTEVENAVNKIGGVSDAFVFYDELTESTFCVIENRENMLQEANVKKILEKKLPEYLVPSVIKIVSEIPVTLSGKKDREEMHIILRKLMCERTQEPKASEQEEYPLVDETVNQKDMTQTQKRLMTIWQEVLGRNNFTIDDNFFRLGGHSLNVVSLAGKIYSELNVMVELSDLFDVTTIRQQVELIETEQANERYLIPKAEKKQYYKVSYSQARMYIYSILNKESILYNTPCAFIVKGKVDTQKVSDCVNQIIARQGCLRTAFEYVEGTIVQHVYDKVEFAIELGELSSGGEDCIIESFLKPFELEKPPLMRMMIAKYKNEEDKQLFIMDMHHIITDGASMFIFIQEFCKLYNGEPLEELPLQYTDFSEWQNELIEDGFYDNQKDYWEQVYKDEIKPIVLSADINAAPKLSKGKILKFSFDEALSEQARSYCMDNNVTMHVLLLAVFSILMSEWCKTDSLVIGTATVGRVQEELYNIIGVFINMMPIRINVDDQTSITKHISMVKKNVISSYENSDIPIDMLRNLLPDMGDQNLIDITFTTQDFSNREINDFKINGMDFIPYDVDSGLYHSKINFVIQKTSPFIELCVEFSSGLFYEDTICSLVSHYEKMLVFALNNSEKYIEELKNDIVEKGD